MDYKDSMMSIAEIAFFNADFLRAQKYLTKEVNVTEYDMNEQNSATYKKRVIPA